MGLHPLRLLLRDVQARGAGSEHGVPCSNQWRTTIAQRRNAFGRIVVVRVGVGRRILTWEAISDSIKHHDDLVLVSIKDILDCIAVCHHADTVHELERCQ